jgi:hypothetical protein
VATDRQISANRHNARRSTGPRSSAGKNRVSRNSYRHGLNANVIPSAEHQKRLIGLSRKFAGQSSNPIVWEYARMAAEAELEQARCERAKFNAIYSVMAPSLRKTPRYTPSQLREIQRLLTRNCDLMSIPLPEPWPDSGPERLTEAIRRALPELLRLERYARRAAGRRERALRIVCAGRGPTVNQ